MTTRAANLFHGIVVSLAVTAFAAGGVAAQQPAAHFVAPKACRASGLWVLERHAAQTVAEHWETLAMAPWSAWDAGFALADGRGSSMAIRVSYTTADRVELTGAQSGDDQDPAVFIRITPSGCVFYTTSDGVVYRFRRER